MKKQNMGELATGLVAHKLVFDCRATTPLQMPRYAGAAVRGALFGALRFQVCTLHGAGRAGGTEWLAGCPVCALFAPADPDADRGRDIARPISIEPPLGSGGLHPAGWTFSFSLTLFGQAVSLYPYIAAGTQVMGRIGLGRYRDAPGQFEVCECWSEEPLNGQRLRIMETQTTALQMPLLPIDDSSVAERVRYLRQDLAGERGIRRVAIQFLTPTRLISDGRLAAAPAFPVLIRRVLRRVSDLCQTTGVGVPKVDFTALVGMAERINLAASDLEWIDLTSASARTGVATPIGGLVGEAEYEGDLDQFIPWLLWAEVTHIGKDATKGNGLCKVIARKTQAE